MTGPRASRLALAAAGAAVLAAYANHFEGSFHFDDVHAIEQNPALRDLRRLPAFFTDSATFSALPSNRSYRPLTSATLAVDWALAGGTRTPVFHADSFAWLLLQCWLVFLLLQRSLARFWPALFGAALFGLHPANAETVNYLIARSDLLSTAGATACVVLWARGGAAREKGLYLVPAALGVLAKEQGAMAAPLLFLWIGLVEQGHSLGALLRPRNLWAALRPALPAFVLCGALAALAVKMAPGWVAGGASRWLYLATQPWVLLHYATMFLAPLQLSADTDWRPVESLADPRVAGGLLFVAAALGAAALASRSPRTRPLAFGLLWFFVALLPTSSVVPLAEVVNDHRMFFPFVGLALCAACLVGLLADRLERGPLERALPVAALLLLSLAGLGTHLRNRVWRTEETLWSDVNQKSPANGRGWMNHALILLGRADYAGARRELQTALRLAPAYGYAHLNLAIAEGRLGEAASAEAHFRRALQLEPGVPAFPYYFGRWLWETGRDGEAEEWLRRAVAAAPEQDDPPALLRRVQRRRAAPGGAEVARQEAALLEERTLGALLEESVRDYQREAFAASLEAADAAARLRPGSARAHNNRCAALNRLGRFGEAAAACREALRLAPELELARNNLRVAESAR